MIYKIYSIFDSKVEAFMSPMFLRANGEAIRAFAAAINDSKHRFSENPEDYTLFEIGEFDDSNAFFKILNTPKSLGVGVEFMKVAS